MSTHWLETRIQGVGRIAASGGGRALNAAVTELVDDLDRHPAVRGAMAARDGLVLARGRAGDFDHDALAALGTSVTSNARAAAPRLGVGPLQQVLLSGPEGKVALFIVGDVVLAIVGDGDVHLGTALAEGP